METTSLDNLFEKHKKPFYVTDRTQIYRVLSKALVGYDVHRQRLLRDGSLIPILSDCVILPEDASQEKWLYVDPVYLRLKS